uniref:Ig-like domain-containing protein n=1 Tax=Varanus komodoensis TaxID=61221 RepID=A0A8D2IR53_VARKO
MSKLLPGHLHYEGASRERPRGFSPCSPLTLPPPLPSAAASSHSLGFFYLGVSEPGQGLPQFIAVGYMDDQLFAQYDSSTRKYQPRVPWMGRVDQFDPQYWDMQLISFSITKKQIPKLNLQIAHECCGPPDSPPDSPPLPGLHTLQWMYGCELSGDGSKGGAFQDGYDGRDFLSFDKETLTWTAVDVRAQLTKWNWEAKPNFAWKIKAYLEEECIERLQRYLGYGKEFLLLRRGVQPPEVKVTRQKSSTEDVETLVCQAHGFYPKEIEATWTKDGQRWEHETFRSRVAPNPDGTYYISLYTDVEPEERGRYRCRVDHAGLSQPLALAWEGPVGERQLGRGEGTDWGLDSGKLSFP